MNCDQVQSLLPAYLDGEVTPSERALVLAHLSGCTVCQQEFDRLSTARNRVRSTLQRRAVQAVPSREAWSRIEAGLSKMQVSFLPGAARPSSTFMAWFARKAPRADHASNRFLGGVTMQKRWIFPGLAGVVALSVLAVLVARTTTPVSARQILDRAYEAQSTQAEGEGIQHMRVETYRNLCARLEGSTVSTVMESYLDLQTGYFRTTTAEAETGNMLDVFAFDGAYVYSGHRSVEVKANAPEQGPKSGTKHLVCDQPWGATQDLLTVYRAAQSNIAGLNRPMSEGAKTHEEIFEKMRSDPQVELLGEETWIDGRTVYVMRSWQPVKALMEESLELPMGWVRSYFDTESYKIVESRATVERDGEEILVHSYRVLADETLPAGSTVPWDLSDLQGVTIVDDPEGQYVGFLPEVVSEEELAKTPSAYLLSNIPEGFTLEISASPKQPVDQPFDYIASYRTEAGDYFVIQSIGSKEIKFMGEEGEETYTTASGLVLTFMEDIQAPDEQFTSAILETPEGRAFLLNSTLPREQVQALAEDIILLSK